MALGCRGDKETADRALRWASHLSIDPGAQTMAPLPQDLRRVTVDGTAWVARLRDGRLCVLLIKERMYRGNYRGLLACGGAIREIYREPGIEQPDRWSIHLPAAGYFAYTFIEKAYDERTYRVFFDLD